MAPLSTVPLINVLATALGRRAANFSSSGILTDSWVPRVGFPKQYLYFQHWIRFLKALDKGRNWWQGAEYLHWFHISNEGMLSLGTKFRAHFSAHSFQRSFQMAINVIPDGKIVTKPFYYLSSQQNYKVCWQLCLPLEVLWIPREAVEVVLSLLGICLFHFRVKLCGSHHKPQSMLRLTFIYWKEFYIH